jgi:hypothetical protein
LSIQRTFVIAVRRSYSVEIRVEATSPEQALALYESGEGEEEVTDAATDEAETLEIFEEVQDV